MTKCLFQMNALELIENKDVLLENLTQKELEYKQKEATILLETDFKELKLTNESMRKAYITQQLSSEKEALESFKNRLAIVNDLIQFRLMEVKQE